MAELAATGGGTGSAEPQRVHNKLKTNSKKYNGSHALYIFTSKFPALL
jgi:hypothetical protein